MAEEEFKSIYLIILISTTIGLYCAFNFNNHLLFPTKLLSNFCHSIVVDLPVDANLDDLASLLQLDTKNMNVEQLDIDLIKEQQKINLKFSSNKTAIIPGDRAQIMLARVCIFLHTRT